MSESSKHHESHESFQNNELNEHVSKQQEQLKNHLEKAAEQAKYTSVEEALKKVDEQTEIASKMTEKESGNGTEKIETESVTTKDLKDAKYEHTLSHIRKKLPAPARSFSKLIHQPIVESASEAAGKTIARPSAFLGGSVAAFCGSAYFLYYAKKYGWEYNFGLFILSFVAGYILGLILEATFQIVLSNFKKS